MEQRTLRLGDTVDDYCPRERRITNHAIVVMAGEEITQTRCTACDADHPYKHGKTPAKKKRSDQGALYDEVLAGVLKPKPAHVEPATPVADEPTPLAVEAAQAIHETPVAPQVIAAQEVAASAAAEEPAMAEPEPAAFSWGHRQLIRAQLPRVEGQTPVVPRPLPDFTIRQQGSRGYGQPNFNNGNGSRRHGGGHGNGNGNGHGRGGRDQGGRSNGRSRHSR
jgi:hypothetical protein